MSLLLRIYKLLILSVSLEIYLGRERFVSAYDVCAHAHFVDEGDG